MTAQDTSQLKERIVSRIRIKGPSLPVHVAKDINTSMLFASAFLSELISEKKLKVSNLKVGNSPLYLIPGQEHLLERSIQYLNNKEKEAFSLLKEKRILKDSEQHPAIRVALTEIKDFAIPFSRNNELYWKYLTVSEEDRDEIINQKAMPLIKEIKKQFEEVEKIEEGKVFPEERVPSEENKRPSDENSKQTQTLPPKKEEKKKTIKKKTSQKKNDKFFNRVKEFLTKKSIEISDIEGFSKNDLTLKIKIKGKEKLLVAYNKKRITETDIINAYKKASELNLEYLILSLGEPLKKLNNFIKAIENLSGIEKID